MKVDNLYPTFQPGFYRIVGADIVAACLPNIEPINEQTITFKESLQTSDIAIMSSEDRLDAIVGILARGLLRLTKDKGARA